MSGSVNLNKPVGNVGSVEPTQAKDVSPPAPLSQPVTALPAEQNATVQLTGQDGELSKRGAALRRLFTGGREAEGRQGGESGRATTSAAASEKQVTRASIGTTPSASTETAATTRGAFELMRRNLMIGAAATVVAPASGSQTVTAAASGIGQSSLVAASTVIDQATRAFMQLHPAVQSSLSHYSNRIDPVELPGIIIQLEVVQRENPVSFSYRAYSWISAGANKSRASFGSPNCEKHFNELKRLNAVEDTIVRHEAFERLDGHTQNFLRVHRSRIDPAQLPELMAKLKSLNSPEARIETIIRQTMTPTELEELGRQALQPRSLPPNEVKWQMIQANTTLDPETKATLSVYRNEISVADLPRVIAKLESLPLEKRGRMLRLLTFSPNKFAEFKQQAMERAGAKLVQSELERAILPPQAAKPLSIALPEPTALVTQTPPSIEVQHAPPQPLAITDDTARVEIDFSKPEQLNRAQRAQLTPPNASPAAAAQPAAAPASVEQPPRAAQPSAHGDTVQQRAGAISQAAAKPAVEAHNNLPTNATIPAETTHTSAQTAARPAPPIPGSGAAGVSGALASVILRYFRSSHHTSATDGSAQASPSGSTITAQEYAQTAAFGAAGGIANNTLERSLERVLRASRTEANLGFGTRLIGLPAFAGGAVGLSVSLLQHGQQLHSDDAEVRAQAAGAIGADTSSAGAMGIGGSLLARAAVRALPWVAARVGTAAAAGMIGAEVVGASGAAIGAAAGPVGSTGAGVLGAVSGYAVAFTAGLIGGAVVEEAMKHSGAKAALEKGASTMWRLQEKTFSDSEVVDAALRSMQ